MRPACSLSKKLFTSSRSQLAPTFALGRPHLLDPGRVLGPARIARVQLAHGLAAPHLAAALGRIIRPAVSFAFFISSSAVRFLRSDFQVFQTAYSSQLLSYVIQHLLQFVYRKLQPRN